ncbi:MAG TPA: 16S rRNA (uracil(1498)-N(3))-methyltransferase [Anaeromyxobacteraceae bacterium]|nr:16S rRNA (uracil(1498)-N(3))-methyltransferase [Anaeromyxobacteraceae bacterium]
MTRARIFVPPERIAGTTAKPDPAGLHHLVDVLRLGPGAAVEVFDGRGNAWEATFTGASLSLGERRQAPRASAAVWVAFALAKGEKADWVVQKTTELGAARLLPWRAERSVMRLEGERAEERARRWRRIAAEAARQCGRSDVPEVSAPVGLAGALQAPPGFVRLAFHGEGGTPLAEGLPRGAPGFLAVIGPEGGMTPRELLLCVEAGCRVVSLGPRVLRAETAAIAAAALLQHLAGDFG